MESTIDLEKIKSDVEDLQEKKNTLILSIKRDIEAIDESLRKTYKQIGEDVYTLASKGVYSLEELGTGFNEVNLLKANRENREKKIIEITARYDEEIDIFTKLIPKQEFDAETETSSDDDLCPSCKTPFTSGVDVYCTNCGYKLV